ncbi:protein TILLER ANGLE CONTROL 1-like [Actinidia eriantha]|uniref:protein TILLER ANGLE CONTROL 1-like n=1 Tax=Actinidia eriantha TaxID=165200 RepID=UPI00258FEC86|nr:protein TILLER ANGLE CONTROL 1-like [Actinidia eriantha]
MKIFNWVHRKFHHKDGFDQNAKKAELVNNETETQVLLDHVTIDGILTIGTFGFDPMNQVNEKNEFLVVERDEFEKEKENVVGYELEEENDDIKVCEYEDENGERAEIGANELDLDMKEIVEGDEGKMKKERTTLADLFMADLDVKTEREGGKLKPDLMKKPNVDAKKKRLSFAKKLIPSVGDEKPPIKKLHRMMRKMMKRKIYPELEEEIQIRDNHIKPTTCGLVADEHGANELVSLLQTKDSIV